VYQVINCGVSGYATREERLFYERFAKKYEPDIVLIIAVRNDDMSFEQEVSSKFVNRRIGKLETIFYVWGKIQDYRYQRPDPDFVKCVKEVLRLNEDVRNDGSRLAVVIFRNDPDYGAIYPLGRIWNELTRSMIIGLKGSSIPVLDLGKALYERHSEEDLVVDPGLDGHPNEIAHSIAAHEIFKMLQREKML
jgi:hypothetical protein